MLKVIVANPTMIKAYKAGVTGNRQPSPEGSKVAKLQWSVHIGIDSTNEHSRRTFRVPVVALGSGRVWRYF